MTYEQFVEQQLAAGQSAEQIQEGINRATSPLFGRCGFCGEIATLLCDYVLGWSGMKLATAEVFTCDTPLCDTCSVNKGITFSAHGVETQDWCPDHHKQDSHAPIAEQEAEAQRQRRRMFLHNKSKGRS